MTRARRRLVSAVEIVALCLLYFVGTWWVGPNVRHVWAKLSFFVFVGVGALHILWISPFVLHSDSPETRGWGGRFSWRNAEVLRPYCVLTLAGAVVLIGIALARDPALFSRIVWRSVAVKLLFYVPFAFVQAMLVFGFLMTRIRDVLEVEPARGPHGAWSRLRVAVATAGLFSLLHLPNGPLMGFVLVAGLVWAWVFYARPSIVLLTASHAILGTLLHRFVELHMRVGPFYGHPNMYFTRILVPGAKELIGNLY